jgi:hypothetical protein
MKSIRLYRSSEFDLDVREDLYELIVDIVHTFNLHESTEMVDPDDIERLADELKELYETYKEKK